MTDTPQTLNLLGIIYARDGELNEENAPAAFVQLCKRLERDNTELLERLQGRTQSHIHASKRDVQTIQQQAVEIDRLKSVNAEMLEVLTSLCSHDSSCGCEISADEAQRWFKACALVAREKGETK